VTEARRPAGTASRVRATLDAAQARMESARSTIPAVDAAYATSMNDRLVGGSLLAGALAYRMFLWLLPLALVLCGGLGFLGAADDDAAGDLADDLGLSAYVSSTVGDAARQAEDGRWVLLVIGLVTLAVASASGLKSLRLVHARAWGLPLSGLRTSPVGVLGFLGFALLAVGTTLVGGWARDASPGLGLGVRLGVVVAFGVLWLVASVLLPRAPGAPWTALIPGALLFAAGAQLLHLLTVFYLAGKLQHSSELYGALGGAAAVLLWLFLIGRIIVGSAVLNATLWERRRRLTDPVEGGRGSL
jgi:uncharacterized BrkB/YihY/UPF0761 family membrane protein